MEKKYEDIIKSLEEMKLTELNELVKAIEDHFGIGASMGVAQASADIGPAAAPSEVTIILTNAGASKVPVIKELAAITGKNLMEAKAMTEKLPATIKEKIKPEEADEIKARLIGKGASVEIK